MRARHDDALPREPIDRWLSPLEHFLHVETAGGLVLLAATALALGLANSPAAAAFEAFWRTPIRFGIGGFQLDHTLRHWINDALMVVFFFVIGLEVKRELVIGELREARRAALPIVAALGGMVVPAGIYLALQAGQPGAPGWGVPMATDIAFVVGCLALLGPRVPALLRVLLLSLAIADDIGAILVIAIGYTEALDLRALGLGIAGLAGIYGLARAGVRSLLVYALAGAGVWVAFHASGVHTTIEGVILGLMTPARAYLSPERFAARLEHAAPGAAGWQEASDRVTRVRSLAWIARETLSPLEYLERLLHPWVAFVIMPLFALANAGVAIDAGLLGHPVAVAVAAGLLLGKPLGIVVFSWLAVRAGIAELPRGIGWGVLTGAGVLAGIGFTMSLFIAALALEGVLLDAAKVGTLAGSTCAALIGLALLVWLLPHARESR